MSGIPVNNSSIDPGGRRIVGLQKVRERLSQILSSGRIGQAYLFAGPAGTGKKALALAFAEILCGIDHLTDLHGKARSAKSTWINHPDIHLFLPIPSGVTLDELKERNRMLADDPYEIINFGLRPSLANDEQSKNRKAFYSIGYFSEQIAPAAYLKPNEAPRTVIIISNVEKMNKEASNAFLKLLEEPSDRVMFLLTTDQIEMLLPTIVSRCQTIRIPPLSPAEISEGLIKFDGFNTDDAEYLGRLSGGNYALTRFFEIENLREIRDDIIEFLRSSYTGDPVKIIQMAEHWNNKFNTEGQLSLLNILESFLRDLLAYRHTQDPSTLINSDKVDVIQNFCKSLQQAQLGQMIDEIGNVRSYLHQNVQPRLIFTVLAIRYTFLMRGLSNSLNEPDDWQHIPALPDAY